jgi:hypothetical protein
MTLMTESGIALLAVRNHALLPGARGTLELVRPASLALAESLDVERQPLVAVFGQTDLVIEEPGPDDLETLGVLVKVLGRQRHEGFGVVLSVEALRRVRCSELSLDADLLTGEIEEVEEFQPRAATAFALADLRATMVQLRPDVEAMLAERDDDLAPGALADLVASGLETSSVEAAALLAECDVVERLRQVQRLVERQHDVLVRLKRMDRRSEAGFVQPWPLEPDGLEQIARRVQDGDLTAEEGARLTQFVEKGYVVWEGLIEPELVDELLADIASIREHPGCFHTTDHRRQRPFRISGPDFDEFESVFDPYVNFESARRACFHPTILRFLELLFDARPMAFQQLLFQRSNEHPLHQDTAYVCLSEPLQLAATWIALEDVVAGRGELTYFEGSHRMPHYLYKDGSKRFGVGDDAERARDELLARAQALGCEKRDFLARKGDVFLWAADLLHGSNPRVRPVDETRRSCVTHYCPEDVEPLSFWKNPELRVRQPVGERAWIASSHYQLPNPGEILRPLYRSAEPS